MTTKNKTVACPNCKNNVIWQAESKFRPFCSERCRLIDLGEWLEEANRIPSTPDFDTGTLSEEDF